MVGPSALRVLGLMQHTKNPPTWHQQILLTLNHIQCFNLLPSFTISHPVCTESHASMPFLLPSSDFKPQPQPNAQTTRSRHTTKTTYMAEPISQLPCPAF